jgi:hypothetical protein
MSDRESEIKESSPIVNIMGLTREEHSRIKYAAALSPEKTMSNWSKKVLIESADAVISQFNS